VLHYRGATVDETGDPGMAGMPFVAAFDAWQQRAGMSFEAGLLLDHWLDSAIFLFGSHPIKAGGGRRQEHSHHRVENHRVENDWMTLSFQVLPFLGFQLSEVCCEGASNAVRLLARIFSSRSSLCSCDAMLLVT
jgi:hypothetical protein